MTDYISAVCLMHVNKTAWDALVERFRRDSDREPTETVALRLLDDGDLMIRKRNGVLEACHYNEPENPPSRYVGRWYQYIPNETRWKWMGSEGWPEDPRAAGQAQI